MLKSVVILQEQWAARPKGPLLWFHALTLGEQWQTGLQRLGCSQHAIVNPMSVVPRVTLAACEAWPYEQCNVMLQQGTAAEVDQNLLLICGQ